MSTKMIKCPVCDEMYVGWREKSNEEWSAHPRCRPSHRSVLSVPDLKVPVEAIGSVDFVPKLLRLPSNKGDHKRGESLPNAFVNQIESSDPHVLTPKVSGRKPVLAPTVPVISKTPRKSHRVGPSTQETVGSLPAKFSVMTTDFPAVFAQASIGVKQISAFKDFCARMSRHEAKNARKLDLIITEESAKIAKATEGDRVVAFTEMWERVVSSLKQAVGDGLKASELIDREVICPLELLEQKVAKSLKEISAQSTKHEVEMRKALAALAKSQDECAKAFAHITVPKETKEVVAKTPQYQTKWQNFRAQIKDHVTKAQETSVIVDMHHNNVAECLDELQELELLRLQFLTIHLERLIVIRRDLRGLEALDSALDSVRSVNARTCVHMFVADWLSDFGPPGKSPMPYAMPLSAEQMEKAEISLEELRVSG